MLLLADMSKLGFSVSASFSVCALLLAVGCGSDSAPSSEGAAGESSDAGATGRAGASAAGSNSEAGSSSSDAGEGGAPNEGGASSGGSSAAGASAAGAGGATSSSSPCSYAVSGGDTFPKGDRTFLCLNNSRLLQKNGSGSYDILFTSAFQDTDKSSSNFACSIDSATPPAAGDKWVLGADHKGVCNLSKAVGMTATLWKASSTPVKGSMTLTFVSAELKHGMSEPKDVYYVFDVEFEGSLPAGDTPDAPTVTVKGHYQAKALPPGN